MKTQVYRGLSLSVDDALRESERVMNEALDHPDAKEGVVSFLERRPPNFERLSGP